MEPETITILLIVATWISAIALIWAVIQSNKVDTDRYRARQNQRLREELDGKNMLLDTYRQTRRKGNVKHV